MTESVRYKTEELKQTILNSEEYQKYDKYRRLLNENPQLKEKVNEFRAANMRLRLDSSSVDRGKIHEIGMVYSDVLAHNVVKEFLNSELMLCKMIQKINIMLIAELELELDFL